MKMVLGEIVVDEFVFAFWMRMYLTILLWRTFTTG